MYLIYVQTFITSPTGYEEDKVVQVIIVPGTCVLPSPRQKFWEISQETLRTVLAHSLGTADPVVGSSQEEKMVTSVSYGTGVTEISPFNYSF